MKGIVELRTSPCFRARLAVTIPFSVRSAFSDGGKAWCGSSGMAIAAMETL